MNRVTPLPVVECRVLITPWPGRISQSSKPVGSLPRCHSRRWPYNNPPLGATSARCGCEPSKRLKTGVPFLWRILPGQQRRAAGRADGIGDETVGKPHPFLSRGGRGAASRCDCCRSSSSACAAWSSVMMKRMFGRSAARTVKTRIRKTSARKGWAILMRRAESTEALECRPAATRQSFDTPMSRSYPLLLSPLPRRSDWISPDDYECTSLA